MIDCITRKEALESAWHNYYPSIDHYCTSVKCATRKDLEAIPAADVVARECYDRILAENDTMREQLAQIGKKPGDSMDNVRPIIKGRWLWDRGTRTCIVCGQMKATDKKDSFCSCCGADNREVTTE